MRQYRMCPGGTCLVKAVVREDIEEDLGGDGANERVVICSIGQVRLQSAQYSGIPDARQEVTRRITV
jgi:hypothetical protein